MVPCMKLTAPELALLMLATGLAVTQPARPSGVQPLDTLRAAAEAAVRADLPTSRYPVTVTADPPDSRLRLAACAQALSTERAAPALGPRNLVYVACGNAWRVIVPVHVVTDLPVLVLRLPAERGRELTAADVEVRRQQVAGLAHLYMSEPGSLAGRRLIRATAAGTVLTAAMFKAQPLVRRGQQVTLLASAAGVDIRAAGRALADGGQHDRIRVQNLTSLKVVEGVVDDSGTVRVSP